MFYTFISEAWIILLELAPYLLLGLLFAGLLNAFVSKEKVQKHLGKKGFASVLKAALLGVPLPLCSCGVIPTGIAFNKQGASKGATVSFLISTPQTGVDSMLITYSMMNLPWAIFRPVVALVSGLIGGLVVDQNEKMEEVASPPEVSSTAQSSLFDKIFKYAFIDFLQDISRPLIAGILLATALTVFLPDTVFTEYMNQPVLNMLIVLLASVPLYVCATGSVPIAAALLAKGLSPGATLVFLMAGPATNAATITVLWNTLGKRTTVLYVATIVVCSFGFGLVIDHLLPTEWFTLHSLNELHHHAHHLIPASLGQLSAVILLGFLIFVEVKRVLPNKTKEMGLNEVKYKVEGMTCNHCKASVEKSVNSIAGVEKAEVNLSEQQVVVTGNVDELEVKKTVEEIGYTFKGRV